MTGAGPPTVESLREMLRQTPGDHVARLRLAQLLLDGGERASARLLLAELEAVDAAGAGEATARLAALDEEAGDSAKALTRWERLLADDIDHPAAGPAARRLRTARTTLSGDAPPAQGLPTLASPENVRTGRYRLLHELGRGASASVYLANDTELAIDVALKILHPHLAGPRMSHACRRFFAEARTSAALRHPGVIAIYDLDENARLLAMEYLPGGALRDRLLASAAGAGLPAEEVRTMARGLLEALAHVHQHGVVHGDITPRNILLREPGTCVLADFGIARLSGTGSDESPAGTPLYLAPEQFHGSASSPATDLFALGLVLGEALAGRPLRTHSDLVAQRFATVPPPEPTIARVAPDLVELVDLLLRAAPHQRPASAGAALAILG